jgi:hypothetical protein
VAEFYELLLNLLGKGDDGTEFRHVLESIGEPCQTYEIASNRHYAFNKMGFGIVYDKEKEKIWMLGFEYATVPIQKGAMVPFPDDLHAGIKATDTPLEVEAKLGIKPSSVRTFKKDNQFRAKYEVAPYVFDCLFESCRGPLKAMSISLLEFQRIK